MKSLYTRLLEHRKRFQVPWEILERDYLLSWILAGISKVEPLHNSLIFKGGTALKKCYFGEYRFSEDLDFSGTEDVPRGAALETSIQEACAMAQQLLNEYAPLEIACERYSENEPHPEGQEAFWVRARFPWHRDLHTRVMVEVSVDEKILKPAKTKSVIHGYEEPLQAHVKVYALEEIVAEKLRAILQHAQRMAMRGWSRSRARDYYDLWRILGTYKDEMSLNGFAAFLHQKCTVKNVNFQNSDDFFREDVLNHVEATWEQWLGPLVPNLPSFKSVIDKLRRQIGETLTA